MYGQDFSTSVSVEAKADKLQKADVYRAFFPGQKKKLYLQTCFPEGHATLDKSNNYVSFLCAIHIFGEKEKQHKLSNSQK